MKNFIVFGSKIEDANCTQQYTLGKDFLFKALSDESKLEFIEKYKWIYFTWDKLVDEQIISAILSLKQWIKNSWENFMIDKEKTHKSKIEKLLFILRNTIEEKESFPALESRINIAKNCKNRIKNILLSAVNKYQNEELQMLYSFHCITFDVLDKLNWFNDDQWSQTKQIMNLLKNNLWIKIFPNSISTDNLENIINNALSIKKNNFDYVEIFTNNTFNQVFLANWKLSMIELLSLPCEDFRLVLPSLWNSLDMLSCSFPGYETYQNICNELRQRNLSDMKIFCVLLNSKFKDWIRLWALQIDCIDKLLSSETENIELSYKQCLYIYNTITKDFNQLIKLREFNLLTLLYIYNNITKDVDEIINDYHHLKNIDWNDLITIHENIKKYGLPNADKIFEKLMKNFWNGKYYGSCHWNIVFLCKHFTKDVLDRFFKNELENFNWSAFVASSNVKNLEFFYNEKIITTFNDFLNESYRHLFYMNLGDLKYLYNKWLCISKDEFSKAWASIFAVNFENVKYLYDEWIYTTLDDLTSDNNAKLLTLNVKSMKFLREKRLCITIEDFIKYQDIIWFADDESLSILCDSQNNDLNFDDKFELFNLISQKKYSADLKNEIIHKIRYLPIDTSKEYLKLCEIFDNSYSSDVQAVKSYLIMDILNTNNPEEVVKKVNTIFMESDLPIISKIFQVFKYIYSANIFNKKLEEHKCASPYLQSCNTYEKKVSTIYKDLMNIMIKSGESSLKEFIKSIIYCRQILYDFENWQVLDDEWYKQLLSLFEKAATLSTVNTNLVRNYEISRPYWTIDTETFKELYNNLKKFLLLRESDSLYTFFLNLCKKLWYNTLEDIINDMEESQEKANNNWISVFISAQQWQAFDPSINYFLKWINLEPLWEILDRWVTSTEYLWWWEWTHDTVSSNRTPFDTDGVIVNWENIFQIAEMHWYGDLAIIINTDKPWIHNTDKGLQWYEPGKYEIFKNHDIDNYYWIRTGIASTEFEAFVYKPSKINLEEVQRIKYLIAKKWFYIPVFDLEGNLLFSPHEYSKLRQSFSFSDKYQWCDIQQKDWNYVSAIQCDKINKWDKTFEDFMIEQKNLSILNRSINNEAIAKLVFDIIKSILESELWIKCNQNKNLLWAELHDSGSTWRWTEIPSNDIDLDFTLLLNSEDYEKLDKIQNIIHEKIWTLQSSDHSTIDGNWLQIKSNINSLWKEFGYEKWIRFDLLILKKTKSYLYPSNVAMWDRLSRVEKLYGKDTLDFVKQNIIIMKKLLKSQWKYKNTEWWMGWIGVENRIMQHHWNFIEALEAFEQVAYRWKYEEDKSNIPFDEFKNLYGIWDCWQNFKDNNNDNYILKMNEAWYNWILNIIKTYRIGWLSWISKLLCAYKDTKAEFLM